MDCSRAGFSVHGILQARILAWKPFPSLGDLPEPGFKPGSLALQADSSPSEPPGKPMHSTLIFFLSGQWSRLFCSLVRELSSGSKNHSCSKWLLRTYYVPGTVLGIGYMTWTDKCLLLRNLDSDKMCTVSYDGKCPGEKRGRRMVHFK